MKIVIEETLLVNFFVILCILKFTTFLTRQKVRLSFLSSLFGAVIGLIYPLFNVDGVLKYAVLFATLSLITLIAFPYSTFKKFCLDFTLLLLATFMLGGACLALAEAVGRFPVFVVAVVGIFVFTILGIVTKIVRRRNNNKKFTYKITFVDDKKVIEEEGYLDSGNVLYDSITNKPIVLVNFDVFSKFYRDVSYLDARLKNIKESSIKNAHYININGIGKGTSMLVFTIDQLILENKYYKNVSLGLSFSGFEKSFGKNVLLHCDFV